MTNNKPILTGANTAARPITILQRNNDVSEDAFDEAIQAQLAHVVIGVRGAGARAAIRQAQTIATTKTVTMIVDLSICLSLAEPQYRDIQEHYKSGVLRIPTNFDRTVDPDDVFSWNAIEEAGTRWKRACTAIYYSHVTHCDALRSAVGGPFTLRLLFDADGERQASDLADELCTRFAAWHRLTTSLREALCAVRSTLLEPQRKYYHHEPMVYCGAKVSKGWTKRIVDPISFLYCDAMEESWSEPRISSELSDLFAARCEAVWSDTAKLLHVTEPQDEDLTDDAVSSDAADEFICADRMLSLWYGDRKRRRRRI